MTKICKNRYDPEFCILGPKVEKLECQLKHCKLNAKKMKWILGEIQDLAGHAKSVYMNDRNDNRADDLIPIFEEIFNKALHGRSFNVTSKPLP